MAIVDSMAHVGNSGMWSCRLCQARYNNTVSLITQLMRTCPHSTTASPLNTISTLSVVNICAHVDLKGSMKMLESYQRVYGVCCPYYPPHLSAIPILTQLGLQAEHTGSEDESDENTTSSTADHGRIELGDDDVEMRDDEANTPGNKEADAEDSSNVVDKTGQRDLDIFPPSPPNYLSEADKKSYRFWQGRKSPLNSFIPSKVPDSHYYPYTLLSSSFRQQAPPASVT